jgi:hypothetical protein
MTAAQPDRSFALGHCSQMKYPLSLSLAPHPLRVAPDAGRPMERTNPHKQQTNSQ